MTKISLFQTFGTGWDLGSGETPLVTAAFVVVVEPDVPVVRGFFLNFLLTRKNIAARIIPRIHNAIKPTNKSLVVDQPKIYKRWFFFNFSFVNKTFCWFYSKWIFVIVYTKMDKNCIGLWIHSLGSSLSSQMKRKKAKEKRECIYYRFDLSLHIVRFKHCFK